MPEAQGKYNATPPTINDGSPSALQVDVNGQLKVVSGTVTPGTGATSLGKAEDAGHTSGDVGIEILAVRNDAEAVLTSTDLDYSPVAVDSSGRLIVSAGKGAFGTSANNLLKAEDAVHTSGDAGVMALGVITNGTTALAALGDYSVEGTDVAGNVRTVGVPLVASATFTPAASSHTAPACNGAAQQFSFGAISGSQIKINSCLMEIDGATIETTTWTLYLYSVTPPSATADTGAWDLVAGDRASFLGKIDIAQIVDLGSTLWIETHNIGKQLLLSGTSVFGYLVNNTTLTPQNVAHKITLLAQQM
jgi:hypothetical protein